mgnify:CR=1 FL=1
MPKLPPPPPPVGAAGAPRGFTGNSQRYYNAADLIIANKDFIAHEAYDRILAKYPALKVKETITITKCRRDVGYLIDATIQDLRLGGNINTIQAAESYYVGTNLSYIDGELTSTDTKSPGIGAIKNLDLSSFFLGFIILFNS